MTQILILVAVILYVLYKQFSAQQIEHKTKSYLILIVIGIYFVYQSSGEIKWDFLLLGAVAFGDILVPVVFGILRALSTRIWVGSDGLVMRKGNWLTLAFWIIYMLIRLTISHFVTDSEHFMLFSLGLSLLVQREIIWLNAQNRFPREIRRNEQLPTRRTRR